MKRSLIILIGLSLLLAVGYNLAMPLGAAPDEAAHAEYVRIVAEEFRLPVLDLSKQSNELDPKGYEAHQPPLYYALAAPAYKIARSAGAGPDGAGRTARGVSTLIGAAGVVLVAVLVLLAVGGEAAGLALAAAAFAAFLPMRLSITASVSNDALAEATATGTLCLLLLGLRRGFDPRLSAWVGVALGAAVLSKASNLLLFPVAVVAVALASQAPPPPILGESAGGHPKPDSPRIGGGGADWGPGGRRGSRKAEPAPSKSQPATGLDLRSGALHLGIAFGVAALVCGWWFARNQIVYGDLLLERTFKTKFANAAISARQAQEMFLFPNLGAYFTGLVLPLTFESFWGAFGHLTGAKSFMGVLPREVGRELAATPEGGAALLRLITLGTLPPRAPIFYPPPSWVYPLLAVWTWVVAAGLGKRYRAARETLTAAQLNPGLVLATCALLVFAALLRFNTEFFQAQGRYLFPALGPLALAFAAGWLAWFGQRRERWGILSLSAAMFALANYALWTVLVPNF